jgi:hypothetical protein
LLVVDEVRVLVEKKEVESAEEVAFELVLPAGSVNIGARTFVTANLDTETCPWRSGSGKLVQGSGRMEGIKGAGCGGRRRKVTFVAEDEDKIEAPKFSESEAHRRLFLGRASFWLRFN